MREAGLGRDDELVSIPVRSFFRMRPKVSSAEPGGGPQLGQSKWVMPRSKARRTSARQLSNRSTSPKLYHSPREMRAGADRLRSAIGHSP